MRVTNGDGLKRTVSITLDESGAGHFDWTVLAGMADEVTADFDADGYTGDTIDVDD